jgi:hypothetical protein
VRKESFPLFTRRLCFGAAKRAEELCRAIISRPAEAGLERDEVSACIHLKQVRFSLVAAEECVSIFFRTGGGIFLTGMANKW